MTFSHYIKDRMQRKNNFNISIAVLHISGLLINFELKIKNSFLIIIKKLLTTMIFGYIFTNRIQPFEAPTISAAFFFSFYSCHTFLNTFQVDISCALAKYSYI